MKFRRAFNLIPVVLVLVAGAATPVGRVAANPTDARARCLSGEAETDEILSACNEAIKRFPKDAPLWNRRAVEREKQGKLDSAIANLNTALRLKPNYGLAYANRGRVYMIKGEYNNALPDLDEAIRLSPDKYPEAYYLRGVIREKSGDSHSALADYEKAAELAPAFEEAANAAKQAGLALGKSEDADAKAASDASTCVNLGSDSGPQGLAACEEAIKRAPGDATLWKALGDRHFNQGRYDLATTDYKETVKLNPNHPTAYLGLAAAWEKRGDPGRAAEFLKMHKEMEKLLFQQAVSPVPLEREPPSTRIARPAPFSFPEADSFFDLDYAQALGALVLFVVGLIGVGLIYSRFRSRRAAPELPSPAILPPAILLSSPQEAVGDTASAPSGVRLSPPRERNALKIEEVLFLVEALESLCRLREQNLISEVEFAKEKTRVMSAQPQAIK